MASALKSTGGRPRAATVLPDASTSPAGPHFGILSYPAVLGESFLSSPEPAVPGILDGQLLL